MEIGQKIKMLRIKKNLTQQQLATLCGYKSLTTINKIEMGINSVPISSIEKLSLALDTTPAYLMGWDNIEKEVLSNSSMTPLHNFGQRIRDRRIEIGLTQDELAKRSGYTSRSSINKIELGIVDLPQSKMVYTNYT